MEVSVDVGHVQEAKEDDHLGADDYQVNEGWDDTRKRLLGLLLFLQFLLKLFVLRLLLA
jgi:hypothetical protein